VARAVGARPAPRGTPPPGAPTATSGG
jgi:hypothetical protein